MATKKKTTKKYDLDSAISEYLTIKEQIKELEARAELLKPMIFENPEDLPKKVIVDFGTYEKEYSLIEKSESINITYQIIKSAGIDPNPLAPYATYPKKLLDAMLGAVGVDKILKSEAYKELEVSTKKKKTYYYKG